MIKNSFDDVYDINYDLFGYDTFFKINNLFDEKYNTALDYSQMDRTFNFGIKRVY